MGGDGSTAEDTFYAKIRPHSLSLLLNAVETSFCLTAEIVRPVRVRNASSLMHVNISGKLIPRSKDRRGRKYDMRPLGGLDDGKR